MGHLDLVGYWLVIKVIRFLIYIQIWIICLVFQEYKKICDKFDVPKKILDWSLLFTEYFVKVGAYGETGFTILDIPAWIEVSKYTKLIPTLFDLYGNVEELEWAVEITSGIAIGQTILEFKFLSYELFKERWPHCERGIISLPKNLHQH